MAKRQGTTDTSIQKRTDAEHLAKGKKDANANKGLKVIKSFGGGTGSYFKGNDGNYYQRRATRAVKVTDKNIINKLNSKQVGNSGK